MDSSGARIDHRPVSSKATPLRLRLPTPPIRKRPASTSRNTAARVDPCHPKVSGISGSFDIGRLICRQAQALAGNPLDKTLRLDLAALEWRSPTAKFRAVLAAMAAVLHLSNSSGVSPTKQTSTRMGSEWAVTRVSRERSGHAAISQVLSLIFPTICLAIVWGPFGYHSLTPPSLFLFSSSINGLSSHKFLLCTLFSPFKKD